MYLGRFESESGKTAPLLADDGWVVTLMQITRRTFFTPSAESEMVAAAHRNSEWLDAESVERHISVYVFFGSLQQASRKPA
jgi:hypothetical protein